MAEKARTDGHRVAILGDLNAAPPGGRWGYSKWSTAAREDKAKTEWVPTKNLTEVLQHGKPAPTWKPWKPSEGSQAFDRVRWPCPLSIFDHTQLTLRLQHSLIGTGSARHVGQTEKLFPNQDAE
jgi:hypothetical protein